MKSIAVEKRVPVGWLIRMLLMTTFYAFSIWLCALVFAQLALLMHWPMLDGALSFVPPRFLPNALGFMLTSFLLGRRWDRPLPSRFSLLFYSVCMLLGVLSMPVYFLTAPPQWTKSIPSIGFSLLFGAVLNLFGAWRLRFMSEDAQSVWLRVYHEDGGRDLIALGYVLGSAVICACLTGLVEFEVLEPFVLAACTAVALALVSHYSQNLLVSLAFYAMGVVGAMSLGSNVASVSDYGFGAVLAVAGFTLAVDYDDGNDQISL